MATDIRQKCKGVTLGLASVMIGSGFTLLAADGGIEIANPTANSNFAGGATITVLGSVEPARSKDANNNWQTDIPTVLLELVFGPYEDPYTGNPIGAVLTDTDSATVTFPVATSRQGAFNGSLDATQYLGYEYPYKVTATPLDAFNKAVPKMGNAFVAIEISDPDPPSPPGGG